jgi:hypothetical protein
MSEKIHALILQSIDMMRSYHEEIRRVISIAREEYSRRNEKLPDYLVDLYCHHAVNAVVFESIVARMVKEKNYG